MNTIGKPYEGKLHVRFDEGGTDNGSNLLFSLAGSTLLHHFMQTHYMTKKHRYILLTKKMVRPDYKNQKEQVLLINNLFANNYKDHIYV